MIKCADVREMLAEYWDLDPEDSRRLLVDEHVRGCPECAEEFRLWEESSHWIRMASMEEAETASQHTSVSGAVMRRIYETDSWRLPIAMRTYHLSARFRRMSLGFLTFFLALFMASFYQAFTDGGAPKETAESFSSFVPVASASASAASTLGGTPEIIGVPVASISEPIVFRMVAVETDPNYWAALSIIGMTAVVLFMNWLSRIKA